MRMQPAMRYIVVLASLLLVATLFPASGTMVSDAAAGDLGAMEQAFSHALTAEAQANGNERALDRPYLFAGRRAAPEEQAYGNERALDRALDVLDRLQNGEDAFPDTWVGGASSRGDIEVVVTHDETRMLYDFVIPGEAASTSIMDELRDWLVQEPQHSEPGHYFLEDHHTGTYVNVVLTLSHGIFWMQFDADKRPTKLWVESQESFESSPFLNQPLDDAVTTTSP